MDLELIENNEAIAIFMDAERHSFDITENHVVYHFKSGYPFDQRVIKDNLVQRIMRQDLNYHRDYGWLMPVVEKIESLDFRVEIAFNQVELYCIKADDSRRFGAAINIPDMDCLKDTDITKRMAIFKVCAQFAKWYNKNLVPNAIPQ